MEIITNPDLYLDRASRGFIKSWYSDDEPTPDKPRLDLVMDVVRSEPTVKAAIRALSDEIVKNGYLIFSKDKRLKKLIDKELEEKFRFKRLLRQIVLNALIYNNVFIEIVYKNNQPDELHILETTEMNIIADEHGEVLKYIQDHDGRTQEFTTDECVHVSIDNITTNLWGEVDLKTLYDTISLKKFIEKWMTNQFRLDKFRDAWSIEEASEPQKKDFVNNLRLARTHIDKELVVEGKIKKILGREIKDMDTLVEILNYCRQQILTLLRVPPIIAGIPDNSNRSNSEVQARKAFDGRIMSLQGTMAEEMTNELFPLMGWEKAEFRFGPIDKRAEKDDIEIIKALKEIGLDDNTLLEYIKSVGIQLPEGAKIETPKPIPTDSDNMKDEASPVEHKTGEDSETRDEQLTGRSIDFIEPYDQLAEEVLKR